MCTYVSVLKGTVLMDIFINFQNVPLPTREREETWTYGSNKKAQRKTTHLHQVEQERTIQLGPND